MSQIRGSWALLTGSHSGAHSSTAVTTNSVPLWRRYSRDRIRARFLTCFYRGAEPLRTHLSAAQQPAVPLCPRGMARSARLVDFQCLLWIPLGLAKPGRTSGKEGRSSGQPGQPHDVYSHRPAGKHPLHCGTCRTEDSGPAWGVGDREKSQERSGQTRCTGRPVLSLPSHSSGFRL